MIRQSRKASYVTRVTCKLLERPEAFLRQGESPDTNIFPRAEMFALIWREIKGIRQQIDDGVLSRRDESGEIKHRKKALLALVQGANEDEIEKILDGENLFNGVKFIPEKASNN